MRILITGRGFDSPREHELGIFELDQARALRAIGHDVRFGAIDTRSFLRRRPLGLRRYDMQGVPVFYCAIPVGAQPVYLADAAQRAAAGRIWRAATEDGWLPDVIHAHFGAGILSLAREKGIAAVYTEHSSAANSDLVSSAELRREREYCALSDQVVCVSSVLRDRLHLHTDIRAEVIPNIVDTAVFAPGHRERREGQFCFVSAGNIIPGKGFDVLLTAFSRLRERGADARLTLIGSGEALPSLRGLSASLGLDGTVEFTGRLSREEMAERYASADAFVLASRAETFGVVFIEAMAAGLPVIATACGGPQDYVDGENGVIIPVDDVPALTDAMEDFCRHADRFDRESLSRRARERFSPETVAGRLTDLYERLLKKDTENQRDGACL